MSAALDTDSSPYFFNDTATTETRSFFMKSSHVLEKA
jgi:hypothetical protein